MTEEAKAARIVVGVDGSPGSAQALRWATRIAAPIARRTCRSRFWRVRAKVAEHATCPVLVIHGE